MRGREGERGCKMGERGGLIVRVFGVFFSSVFSSQSEAIAGRIWEREGVY